ncbi:hypothetical protein OnM2_077060 [Erysiphe neolycopersici]|uniref:Uncharacterized protein n=1 Tax=Erysiphe neolycopersici TaxID=212602 RepID=A0A420HHT2_9PEZI|nr:hypothetical protein OnM2_077060 [Erysiphe neolycopersici]
MENEELDPKYNGPIKKRSPNKVVIEPDRALKISLNYMCSREINQDYICRQEQQRIEAVRKAKDSEYETSSMEYEKSTTESTACSQSSSPSSIISSKVPDTTPSRPSVRLLYGDIYRDYSIENDSYSSSRESTAQIEYSSTSNFDLSSKKSLVAYGELQDLFLFLSELKKQDTEGPTLSSGKERNYSEWHCKPIASEANDIIQLKINEKLSKDEKIIFFKMLDQLNLIDLVRAHQSIDQGSFRKAPKPLSQPVDLGLPEAFAREDPWLYNCVWCHRLRFRFAKGSEGCLRHKYPTEMRVEQAPIQNRSHLSNCIRPEDITNVTPPKISIKHTSRNKPCSQSEPYLLLLTKQCEQVNNLVVDTSFLERTISENFYNYENKEKEKEDVYDDDEDFEDDSYYDSDSDSNGNSNSNSNNNRNSDSDSDSYSQESYFGLKRLTEFLVGYHQNDSISNKKLCRGHNI